MGKQNKPVKKSTAKPKVTGKNSKPAEETKSKKFLDDDEEEDFDMPIDDMDDFDDMGYDDEDDY